MAALDETTSFTAEQGNTEASAEIPTIQPRYTLISDVSGATRRYDNTEGICGTVAAVILLMYYRDNVDSFVVPSWHDTSTGESLMDLLYPQIEIYDPGSSHASVINGLNYYFRWRGIADEYSASAVTLSIDSYKNYISTKDRPVLLGIQRLAHMTVGTGWRYISETNTYYAKVNEGWGNANDVYYAWSEMDWMAAINK